MKWLIIGIVIIVAFVISVLITMAVWYWVVPDIFVGFVKQGLLPDSLTFVQAFKLMAFLWGLGIVSQTNGNNKK